MFPLTSHDFTTIDSVLISVHHSNTSRTCDSNHITGHSVYTFDCKENKTLEDCGSKLHALLGLKISSVRDTCDPSLPVTRRSITLIPSVNREPLILIGKETACEGKEKELM